MDSVFPSATPSILVVEDDAELRGATVRPLTQVGYEAVPASSDGIAPRPRPENLTAARIKPASSFVYLS